MPHAGAVTEADAAPLAATLCYKGRSERVSLPGTSELRELFEEASRLFHLPAEDFELKLVLRGKTLQPAAAAADVLGPAAAAPPKLLVMATAREAIARVHSATPDASVNSFAAEHGGRKARVPTSRGVRAEGGGSRKGR